MEKIRLYYDKEANTLNVWFDDPEKEHICEETKLPIDPLRNRPLVRPINHGLSSVRHFEI